MRIKINFISTGSYLDPVYMEWGSQSSGVSFFCFVSSRA